MFLFIVFIVIAAFYNYPHLPVILPGLTIVKLVGAITLVAALAGAISTTRSLQMFRRGEGRLYVALFFLMTLSALINGWGAAQNLYLWTYASHLGFYFIASVVVTSEKKMATTCYWLVASVVLIALSVIKDRIRWDVPRPGGIAGDPNYYALIAICVVPLCLLAVERSKGWGRLFLLASGMLIIAAMLIGASRGGALALIVAGCYAILHLRRKVLLGGLAALTMAGLLVVVPNSLIDRIQNPDYGSDVSADARLDLWNAGLRMVAANPVFGVGPANFAPATEVYSEGHSGQIAHNTYIEVAAEFGLPAFALWSAILFVSWNRMRRLGKRLTAAGDATGAWMANSFKVGVVGYSAAAVFISAAYIRHAWFIIFLGVVLEKVATLNQPASEPAKRPQTAGRWRTRPVPIPG